jgi:Flp pilus assembly protein TadD
MRLHEQMTIEQAIQFAIEHHQAGRLDEAEAGYREILSSHSDDANALRLLGILVMQRGQADQAVQLISRAIALNPAAAEYHVNLGNALKAAGKTDAAVQAYHEAVRLRPRYHQAFYNLGIALADRGKLQQAIEAYEDALRIMPAYPDALNNLGAVLEKREQVEEAIAAYRQAIALRPGYAEAWHNLGHAQADLGRLDEAAGAYREALRLAPDFVGAHWNLALVLLMQGEFAQGWIEYEWRWQSDGFPTPRRQFSRPQWDGSPLNERTLLLHTEQGFGDAIQFIRYAPLLARDSGRVVLACQPEMMELMKGVAGVAQIMNVDELAIDLPPFDVHCPLISLPLKMGTRLESIPAQTPYMTADECKAQAWGRKLASAPPGLRVGLVWSGRTRTPEQRRRAIRFSQLAPLWQAKGVSFYSLQKGEAALQAAGCGPEMPLTDLADELHDFSDTAAVISNLDLIIAVDTAVAHLAGAMGKPVWVMLAAVPDWRWMLGREDSLWYPTARLFRQRTAGDWNEVIVRVVGELRVASR